MTTYYISSDENDVVKKENGDALVFRTGSEVWQPYEGSGELHAVTEEEAAEQIAENRAMYDRLLLLADKTAEKAHEGQLGFDGQPYVTHPRTVASFLDDTEHKITALLHDTIEDTDMTAQRLLELGFTKRIVRSVAALTRAEDTDYMDYIASLLTDPNAKYVKLADLRHNMDISRIPHPTEHDFERIEKYRRAREFLLKGI